MKNILGLLLLTAPAWVGCAGAPDWDSEEAWQAYLEELKKPVDRVDLTQARKANPYPFWFEGPNSFYDTWLRAGTWLFPHRPTWRAHRLLGGEMEQAGLVRRGALMPHEGAQPPSDEGVDFLVAMASHEDGPVRAVTVFLLGDLPVLSERPGIRSKLLQPLLKSLSDPEPIVRAAGAHSIGRLLDAVKEGRTLAEGPLAALLKDPLPFTRHNAAVTLARFEMAPLEAVPILRNDLGDPEAWIAASAAAALMKMGGRAATAVPELVDALRHPNEAVRTNAREALKSIDPTRLAGTQN